MKLEIILLCGAVFFVVDTIYDNKYTKVLKGYKKHAKIAGIIFAALSLYSFTKKNPSESASLMSHVNGMIRYMPLDKQAKDLMSPFMSAQPVYHEQRILQSGGEATGRSVSGTKKKYVAAQQQWKCGECGVQLDAWFEVDHKKRLADGGSNHISNLVALCRNCHGKKTTMENL